MGENWPTYAYARPRYLCKRSGGGGCLHMSFLSVDEPESYPSNDGGRWVAESWRLDGGAEKSERKVSESAEFCVRAVRDRHYLFAEGKVSVGLQVYI